MSLSGLGDRAQLFLNQRQNADLRSRMASRTEEMATGVASDVTAHLRGDTAPLVDLDRRLALADSYRSAAAEAAARLSLMQEAADRMDGTRADVLEALMNPAVAGDRTIASNAARSGFEDIVSALNTRLGSAALFAGKENVGAALDSAQDMMDRIQVAVAGSATATEVEDRLDDWFNDPLGFYAAYQGSGTSLTRAVDANATVTLDLRAGDPTLRGLLKAVSLAALAKDTTLPLSDSVSQELLTRSRDSLLSLSVPMVEARSRLGQAQARVEEATARHAARSSAWTLMRNEMMQIDPYDTASEIEALRTQLQTHYELTSRLSSLNLVSFLR